jgi:hypothetical protein
LKGATYEKLKTEFPSALASLNSQETERILGAVFAAVSCHQRPETDNKEAHYHAVLQAFMAGMYLDVRSEVASAEGRVDLVVVLPGDVYVIVELKCAPRPADVDPEAKRLVLSKGADAALEQIREKGYSRQFRLKAKRIVEMGLSVFGQGEVMVKFAEG